jgi:hypothetical protein
VNATSELVTRFAVVCSGSTMPAWQAECLRHLRRTDAAALTALAVNEATTVDRQSSGNCLDRASERVLERTTNSETPVDASDELGAVERFGCSVRMRDGERLLGAASTAAVDTRPDVLLAFGVDRATDAVRESVPHGVWTFSHDSTGCSVPGFESFLADDPVVQATLWRLAHGDGGVPLKRGVFPTIAHSLGQTADQIRFASARWPAQVAIDIRHSRADSVDGPAESVAQTQRAPTPTRVGAILGKQLRGLADIATTGADNWRVGVIDAPIADVAAEPDGVDIRWIPMSRTDRFMADPFVAPVDDQLYLFFEDLRYETGKGTISYLPFEGTLRADRIEPALEQPYHLSYPYPITHKGTTYVVPETAQQGDITLYELEAPDDWKRVGTLVSGTRGLDPTIVEYGDRWWLFCTRLDDLSTTNLWLYHAPRPSGEWTAHANNPVKTDVRSARSAGTPWIEDGRLYRPAQYCAGGYGKKILVNRVETLTPTAFAERPVSEISPDPNGPYPDGLHTISGYGDVTVIDGNRAVLDASHLRRRLGIAARAVFRRLPRRNT